MAKALVAFCSELAKNSAQSIKHRQVFVCTAYIRSDTQADVYGILVDCLKRQFQSQNQVCTFS